MKELKTYYCLVLDRQEGLISKVFYLKDSNALLDTIAKAGITLINFLEKDEHGKCLDSDYICPVCGCREYDFDEIATTGTGFSRLLDWQNREMLVQSCSNCGFMKTFLKRNINETGKIDFFFG